MSQYYRYMKNNIGKYTEFYRQYDPGKVVSYIPDITKIFKAKIPIRIPLQGVF